MKSSLKLVLSASVSTLACAATATHAQIANPPAATVPGVQAVPLEDQDGTSDIVVTGLRKSLAEAADIKKNADQIVDTVVAEDIGKLPDNNASEAIARITGVQVNRSGDEANGVLIRGLPQVATTVQGRELFTADGRSVAVQDFPADSLAALEVFKSNTAENLEGGIAGLINVRLRRPFDLPKGLTVAGGVRGIYYDQAKKYDPQGNILVSDRWDTGIGEIGVLLNGSYTSADYLTSVRYDGFRNTPDASNTVSPASVGRNFTFPQDIGIYYNRGHRYRPSANGSIQWAPSNDVMIYIDGLYQGYRGQGEDDFLGLPIRGGGRPITNVVLSDAATPDGVPEAQSLSTVLIGTNGPSKNTGDVNTDTWQAAIGGNWKTGRATLSADIAYTKSVVNGYNINFDTLFANPVPLNADFNIGYGVEFTTPGFDQRNPANYYFRGLYQQVNRTIGESLQTRFDGKLDTDIDLLPEIDWGLRFQRRTAESAQADRYAAQGDLQIPLSQVPGFDGTLIAPGFQGQDVQQFRDWPQITRGQLRGGIDDILAFVRANDAGRATPTPGFTTLFDGGRPLLPAVPTYSSLERTATAYAQVKYLFDIGFPIDGIVGARVVNTVTRLNGRSTILGEVSDSSNATNYINVLPNASMRLRFTDKLQLRLAYTKSFTRPGFTQTNGSIVINPSTVGGVSGYSASRGNPELGPIKSTNYDASLEYYFSRTGSASLAVFKRDVDGFIVTLLDQNFFLPGFGTVALTQPVNAGSGKIKGVEAAFNTFFTFLPAPFDGLGVQANATYIDGQQQVPAALGAQGALGLIPGTSKWTYNLNGIYEKGPFSMRLAYNRRSDFITNYNSGGATGFAAEYTKAISRLDFSASVTPVKWLTITADATNLLGQPFEDYFRDPVYPRDVRYEAKTYSLGARFRF